MLSFYCGAPQWLVEVAIEPKSNGDQEKLVAALARLAAEDPSFRFSVDPQSGQIILKGMGEIQLATKVDLLKSAYQIDARVGALQVAFLERITTRVEHSFTHKMQTGAAGRFAAVTLLVEPNEPGRGNVFESRVTDGAVPAHYTPGVEKGVESVLSSGVVAGYPVVDVRVRLLDGKYHDGDFTVMAFEIATRACFREALQMGKSVLLEPVMAVEVVTLDDRADSVIRNMDLRRGQIVRRYIRDGATVIDALVPLMNMFGYVNDLREIGESRATFIMRFDHYAEAPPNGDGHPPAFPPAIGMRA